jgi:hypothetical protein
VATWGRAASNELEKAIRSASAKSSELFKSSALVCSTNLCEMVSVSYASVEESARRRADHHHRAQIRPRPPEVRLDGHRYP